MLPRIVQWYDVLLGCLHLGAIPMPATMQLSARDVAYRVNLADATAVVTDATGVAAVGAALMDAITAAAIAAWSTIVNAATRLYLRFKQRFNEIDWGSIGRSVIDGIKNGVLSAAAGLGHAAANAARRALDAAKRALGIQSPSMVAAEEVGRPLAMGIAMGIDQEARGIADAVEAVLSAALAAQPGASPAAAAAGAIQLAVYQYFGATPESPASIGRASGTGLLDALQRLGLPG